MKNFSSDLRQLLLNCGLPEKCINVACSDIIKEHAKYLDDYRARISDRKYPIEEHIVKMLLFPNHTAFNHWVSEIASLFTFFNSKKVKTQKKTRFLTTEEKLKIWDISDFENFKIIVDLLCNEYKVKEITPTEEDYQKFVGIITDLCSINRRTTNEDVISAYQKYI